MLNGMDKEPHSFQNTCLNFPVNTEYISISKMALTKALGFHIHAHGCANLHMHAPTRLEDKGYGPPGKSVHTRMDMMHGIAPLHLTVPTAV